MILYIFLHSLCSSCPSPPAVCDWNTYSNPSPKLHILFGGLVGGPDANDTYIDVRTNIAGNSVAIDYNAAFQSNIAGLLQH